MLLLVGLFWLGGVQGSVLGLVVTGFGLLPLITGLTGVCPLYIPFGISTLEKEKELMARCASMAASCMPGHRRPGQTPEPDPQSIGNPGNGKVVAERQTLLQPYTNIRQTNEGRLPAALLSSHANDPFFSRIGMRRLCIGKNAYMWKRHSALTSYPVLC
jgi:hypothetical protein